MPRRPTRSAVLAVCALAAPLLAGGCSTVVMDPAGDVARQQSQIIWMSTALMLVIVLPVIAMTLFFAWRYRASNKADVPYDPDWDHSTGLELVIWAMPLAIVTALGALTWAATHLLDPYRPLSRVEAGRPLAAGVKPLEIQVVSLDWKWLFIYPEQGIATVNELALPVDRPVRFRMTSSSVMNTFWVPSMAGMIYTMPGMETTLHGVLNKVGRVEGRSGHYSGAGFSGMTFWTYAVPDARFDRWAAGVRRQPRALDLAVYEQLSKPSENVRPIGFGRVDPDLFRRIVAMCVKPGEVCAEHGRADAHGVRSPVNDRAPRADEAKGALTRDPSQLGTSPHRNAPRGNAPGSTDPGSNANRNMTLLDIRSPLAPATARG